ncbi:MAG: hypothetical protein K0R30_380 [Ornithinibacter sp.]|nr:hypothetical protein [Ornithinibacter sp.]
MTAPGVRLGGWGNPYVMSTNETSPAKDPDDWATGDEPATAAQLSYLRTLAHDSGREVPENVSKADASRLIDELRAESPRVSGDPGQG